MEQKRTLVQICNNENEGGERCVLEVGHWPGTAHETAPDLFGMITAWGQPPLDTVEILCSAECGMTVGADPREPTPVIEHRQDGSHVVTTEAGAFMVEALVEPPPSEAEFDLELKPEYHVTSSVNGRVVGAAMRPIEDPFISTTVGISIGDVLRALLAWLSAPFGKKSVLRVQVEVGGNWDAMKHVFTARPIRQTTPRTVMMGGGVRQE